jgi:hypothetical protein
MSLKLIGRLLMIFGATACSSRQVHVRGELDRRTWVVQTCEASESYRVMMTSDQAAYFLDLEKQLGAKRPEPVILEFDAFTIPPKFPWNAHETVGVDGPMNLERGTCSSSGRP